MPQARRIDNIFFRTLDEICRRQMCRHGWSSRLPKNIFRYHSAQNIDSGDTTLEFDDIFRLPEFGTIADSKPFRAGRDCGEARLIDIAIDGKESIRSGRINHFVERQMDASFRSTPRLGRYSAQSITIDSGSRTLSSKCIDVLFVVCK